MMSSLKKCDSVNCDLPATLFNNEKHMCDKHTTVDIVSKSSSEDDWKEIANVEQVRFISDYLKISSELEKTSIVH